MSNFNKVVTNIPVSLTETEMSNLSQTFSGIIQGGGGGGGEGKRYIGDGVYVTVNNDANPGVIALTQTSLEKLNKEIPSAVSSFPDSIQYAKITEIPDSITDFADTSAVIYSYINPATADIQQQLNGKQNKLQFDLNAKGEISAIGSVNNTTALAGANGITGDYYSASNPSGFITPTTLEPILQNKHYVTSSNEIIQGSAQYGLTTAGWTVIQGAGGGTGITEVSHDTTLSGNGNSQALGVNFNHVQPKGDYVSATDIADMATKTWVGEQGYITTIPSEYITETELASYNYATTALLDTISSKIENDIPTTVAQLTDSGNYYKKSETSGASEIENALTGKQDKLTFAGESNTITSINNSAVGGGTSFTGVTTAGSISGDGLTNPLGLVTSAEQALAAVDGKISKPTASQQQLVYVVWDKGPAQHWTDFGVAANSWANTFLFDEEYPIVNGNNGLSAGLVPGEYNDVYEVGIDTTNMAANKQYAFTTTGWAEVQAGTSFTGVTTGTGLSGTGLSNSPLGVDTTAAIYFTNGSAKSAISAGSATNAVSADKAVSASASKRLQDSTSGPVIQVGDVTALQNWASSNSSTWNDVTAKLGTAQYALDSATFVTSSSNTITGTKQYALTTAGWEVVSTPTIPDITANNGLSANGHTIGIDNTNLVADTQYAWTTTGWSDIGLSAYLPTSGGTVSGQLVISGGSNFDQQFLKITRENVNGHARLGLGQYGALALKTDDNNSHTTQINISPNATNDQLVQVQHNGSTVGYLIPAVTSTTTAGLTNDGILHIILES